jgi:O-antigen/teichoic acid export membrane protein
MTGPGVPGVPDPATQEARETEVTLGIAAGELPSRRRPSLFKVVGGLSALNIGIAMAGLLTGPLQARALGPSGRGDLAAIMVPLTLAPGVLGLALGAYATREAARGRNIGELLGSLGAVVLATSLIGVFGGLVAADWLAEGREVVRTFLLVGAALLPLSLVAGIPSSMLASLEMWRLFAVFRLIPMLIFVGGTVGFYLADALTVEVSAVLLLIGGVTSAFVLLPFCLRHRPWTFRRQVAREGTIFGLKFWAGGLAQLLNGRLDQLLMIKLVSSSQLGFYAIAATIATLPGFLAGAVGPPLLSRIAAGDRGLVQRAMRCTLAVSFALAAAASAAAPFLVPAIFGDAFSESVPFAIVLLGAGVMYTTANVATAALVADGAPGVTSFAEVAACVVTVGGLALFLARFGPMAAAVVSAAAATTAFSIQMAVVLRRFGGGFRDYLLIRPSDVRWFIAQVRPRREQEVL